LDTQGSLPRRVKVVVIGGGVAGSSLLFHLAKLGVTDCLLLEQQELTSGSTWHAAGLCTQFSTDRSLTRVLKDSVDLYRRLEEETSQGIGFHGCGSLRLAVSQDNLDELARAKGIADVVGVPFEIVPSRRVSDLFPLASLRGVSGAAYLPTDGYVDPASLATALAKAAGESGATILRHTRVTGLLQRPRIGWQVETTKGSVDAEFVVNAAGMWARDVGRLAGVDLPIRPLEHQYLVTEPLPQLHSREPELPVLRDPGGSFYVRQELDGLLVGPFEGDPAPWATEMIPEDFSNRLLSPQLDRIEDVLAAVSERIPAFEGVGIKRVVNGPDGYTPDGRCLMGPVPGLRNFHVLAGFSIFGIVFSGGAGRQAAEWIVHGQPSEDMWPLDVRRFGDYATSTEYVTQHASQTYAREYSIRFPLEELPAGRKLKTSPLYDRLASHGAVFGERYGWERPLFFSAVTLLESPPTYSFRRPSWHETVGNECRGVRTRAGILDQTSFAKFEVAGPRARRLLDYLCANALPSHDRIALTQLCTEQGGIECDVTVSQLAEDRFYVVSAAATATHDYEWIADHCPRRGVTLDDLTGRYGVLTLAGPASKEILQELTHFDCSDKSFPFFSVRQIHVGMAPARVLRLSYTGELGYELHHPLEYQGYLYDILREVGERHGLVEFGYYALESMRLEMGYRLWGADISPQHTPLEAGLERFVSFDKGEFLGRGALRRQKETGLQRGLAALVVDADDSDCHGYEPVYYGDRLVSSVECGGYGHTIGASLAHAYLPSECLEPGTRLSIEVLGEKMPAAVVAEPPIRGLGVVSRAPEGPRHEGSARE